MKHAWSKWDFRLDTVDIVLMAFCAGIGSDFQSLTKLQHRVLYLCSYQ